MKCRGTMKSIEWIGKKVKIIDQTRLPLEEIYIETADYRVVAEAIRKLKIRGAPAIGIAAAFGFALGACEFEGEDKGKFREHLARVKETLASTRPTAVNLFWALERMERVLQSYPSGTVGALKAFLVEEAVRIQKEDVEKCRRIGEFGVQLVPEKAGILTHCNTGALATGDYGTAQSIITSAHAHGKQIRVYVGETRPLLQGARLTMWELSTLGIDATLITDNAAAFLMKKGFINLVVVGADRIAKNGDVANKIGTYNLAVLAEKHRIPFYVAAPTSSIDFRIASGEAIPIEERDPSEITEGFGKRIAPRGVKVYSPAFDITPNELVTAIVTEMGVCRPPFSESIPALESARETIA